MILYHGSNMHIETIELSRCNRFKDFGQAFYLSADKKQAEEIAEAFEGRDNVKKLLTLLLENLDYINIPENEIWMGDFLFLNETTNHFSPSSKIVRHLSETKTNLIQIF